MTIKILKVYLSLGFHNWLIGLDMTLSGQCTIVTNKAMTK